MKKVSILFFTILILCNYTLEGSTIERRAAIDVGSGGTKVAIADVDKESGKIVQVILQESFPVPYQAALESSYDGSFDQEIRDKGLRTFKEIKDLAEHYQVEKIAAVATAAFRNAANGYEFAAEIHTETGIPLRIISQKEEGEIAFNSAIAAENFPKDKILVWDIGTGSFQMTVLNESNHLTVFMGEMGSVPFRNYIIDVIQDKNSDEIASPNPISDNDLKIADSFARSIARKAYPIIKEKIKDGETEILGIGRLFSSSIAPFAEDSTAINRKDLRTFIYNALLKTDEEIGDPFAHVDVSNAILVLAFMKALHIQKIHALETKSTDGILVNKKYY
jgi:exopolyphosphatase/guanosine-5'-triphosphate,3'-diphosphate pyrophosphatase